MKTFHIVEETTIKTTFEITIPDEVAAKGEEAIYDYFYMLSDPDTFIIESECADVDAIDCYEIYTGE